MSSKANFFQRAEVATTDFADFRLSWDFISAGMLLLNESTTTGDIVEYSFDGTNVHGDLDPDLPSAGIIFDARHESKIWLRLKSAGSVVNVRVEAWQ